MSRESLTARMTPRLQENYDLLDASAGFLDSHAALMASDLNPHAVARGEN